MDLGLAFDDEDLQSARKITRDDTGLPYNVKLCTPKWFESALELHQSDQPDSSHLNPDQVPRTFKFSGDYHYYQGLYGKAAQQYELALAKLAENNVSVRQDLRESVCRCYMHLGRTDESLHLARELVKEMSQEDEAHQRQSLTLMSLVCEKAGKWAECAESLEKLCCLQPCYHQSWSQLGGAYTQLFRESSSISDADGTVIDSTADTKTVEQLVRLLTCCIRASLLSQVAISKASSIIKKRNESLITQISEKISRIPIPDAEKTFAFQHIQREIEKQSIDSKNPCLGSDRNDSTAVTENLHNLSTAGSVSRLFYSRFCSWYWKQSGKSLK